MHPEIDRFASLDRWLQRWDPRWKLSAFAMLALAVAIDRPHASSSPEAVRDLPPALAGLGLAALLVLVAGVPPLHALRRLRPALYLLGLILILYPLVHPGPTVGLGPLHLSRDGLLRGATIAIKAFSIMLLVFPALGTTRFDLTLKALRALRVPSPLVVTALFGYRYIFVYLDQHRKLRLAMRSRGFRARLDLATLRTLGRSVGVLLVGSLERTERIRAAMRSRGYSGELPTCGEFRTRVVDVASFALVAGLGALLIIWRMR